MMTNKQFVSVKKKLQIGALSLALLVGPFLAAGSVSPVRAANLTSMSVTLSDNINSNSSNWTQNFTTATTGTIATVEMIFGTGVDVSGVSLGSVSGIGAGSIAISGQKVTYTVTSPASINSGVAISIQLTGVTNPATIGNYSVGFITKNGSGVRIDDGATLAYLDADGSAGGITDNQVTVTADVNPLIELGIYSDSGLTTTTNACALGTLTTTGVSSCTYYLRVGTNDNSGYTLKVIADAQLNNAGNTADINAVADGTVTAGSEEYGFTLTAGTGSSSSITADTAVPTVTTTAATSSGPIASGTSTANTVTHEASITSATPAEVYDQIVTYTMFSN